MRNLRFLSIVMVSLFLLSNFSIAQETKTTITGKVMDVSANESVIGANVYIKGTTIGTVTDLDGKFIFSTSLTGEQTVVISSIGMTTVEKTVTLSGTAIEMGTIEQESDAVGLAEVMIFADVAIDRRTPVAASNVKPEQIEAKLGSQEFPEILKSTPGVYATKQGGAFGDSRINIRGFNARYVAVMINGVPVNDMENNWVYWSNWAGLSDVTRSMQVQRGLGASKVAIPSVGGTINILTKTTDAEKGGSAYVATGDNNYSKFGVTLSSGLTENGWATTLSLARSQGNGWVDGTQFESSSYFLNISKIVNNNHRLAFTLFGAPQWHGQRSSKMYIDEYKDPRINDIRYNKDWGYKNGQVYNVRKNFYHKPKAILNHSWTINDRLSMFTAAYVSLGTGGGTGPLGDNKFYQDDYLRENQPDIDRIVDENIAAGANGSETILRASNNNHFWTGILPQIKYNMDWLTISGGLDIRYYVGEHYREVVDLLGGNYYLDDSDVNNPNKSAYVGDKVAYYNDGIVGWYGGFGQGEVVYGELSAFVNAAVSNKSYTRVEYFLEEHSGEGAVSKKYNFLGYSAKGGANYNLTEDHNVYVNAGFFTNPPDFRTVFYNYTNDANEDAPNEKVLSLEAGYGYRSSWLTANLNLYYTTWKDKARVLSLRNTDGSDFFANLTGIDALHQGVELEVTVRPVSKLTINAMGSLGDWRWMNDIRDVQFFDDNRNPIGDPVNVYIKDIHVGDAAQTTAALGANYEFIKGVSIGADYNYYDRLFANFSPETRTDEPTNEGDNPDAWQIPSYHMLDANLRFRFDVGQNKATLIFNMNNLLDTEHITDADDGPQHDWQSATVYYGWGRSWRLSLKFEF